MGILILVVEHNTVYLDGLASLIGSQPDMEVAGISKTAGAALSLHRTVNPDLTLVDLDLPQQKGVQVIEQIRALAPAAVIIGLVTYELASSGTAALASGAAAVVAKDQVAETLPHLIRSLVRR
jgi:DNA-binding NarL/FixJ family response regulator